MNNDEIKVSVIIPIYNVEDYLEECLDSVLNQTLDGIEVIMIDDGSPDGSSAIAEAYAAKYENFRYIRQKNGGLGNARNNGAKLARGEYIAFLDSDDAVTEYAYEKLYKVARDRDKDIVTGNIIRFDESKTFSSKLHDNVFRHFGVDTDIYSNNGLLYDTTSTNKLYRRSFWKERALAFPEKVYYEDIPVTITAYCMTEKVGIIHDTVYLWRKREGENKSITQQRGDIKSFTDRLRVIKIVDDYFKENIDDQKLIDAKNYRWVFTDFKLFLNQYEAMDPENYSKLMNLMQEYIDENIPEAIFEGLPVIYRGMYSALKDRDIDRIRVLRELEKHGMYENLRITNEDGHIYGYFPKEIQSEPADLRLQISQQNLRQSIGDIIFQDTKCIIKGYALIRGLTTTVAEPGCLQAYLYREETDERLKLQTSVTASPAAQKKFGIGIDGMQLNDYIMSGYEIQIELEDIIGKGCLGDYKILLDYSNRGIERQALLAGGGGKFKKNTKDIYGNCTDKGVSFRYEISGFLVMSIGDKIEQKRILKKKSIRSLIARIRS